MEVWVMIARDPNGSEDYVEDVYSSKEAAERDREIKKTMRVNRGIKFPINRYVVKD